MITKSSSLYDLSQIPEFSEFFEFILPTKFVLSEAELKEITIGSYDRVWDTSVIPDGLMYLRSLVQKGNKVFYRLSEQEALKDRVFFHFPVEKKTKFAVILPGGGYGSVVHFLEGFPGAKRLNELGYHAFTINYRVKEPGRAPNPMDDLATAVKYIIDNADKLNVDTSDYAVMGFSAGGHVAASFASNATGYMKYSLPKPGCMILAYPVVTMGEYAHAGSRDNLLQQDKDNESIQDLYSVEKHVDGSFPPTYMWQCDPDWTVPIQNTRMLADSLKKSNVPYHYETYDQGGHGWGMAYNKVASGWFDKAIKYWEGTWTK